MFDHIRYLTEYFDPFLLRLHGSIHADLYYAVAIFAWAKALSSIGAAYMKRMIPLRTFAMLANVFGVAVGIGTGSLATFLEHAVNLPLNAVRLRGMRRLVASVREASANDLKIEWLKPFMHPRGLKAGSLIFSRGDEAKEAFVLVEGRVVIAESSAALEPGAIFGEMALFTASGQRTASAVCTCDVRLLVITYEQFEQLYFQNPEFGLYLVRLIVRRFEMNLAALNAGKISAAG
jgi:CRP/FNR family transcriptional regulator, cyclic AMP receptor protein